MEQNLNLYQVFYTVAKCGNISAAASKLYISQPAISKSISKLEAGLNVTLFKRSSRGVTLTMEGEMLFKQVEAAYLALKLGEDNLRKVSELGIGNLSIGVSTTLCRYILLPYLKTFSKNNPHVRVSIQCQSSNKTIQALENGNLDIGLIGEFEPRGNLVFQPLMEIQDIFVSGKSYLENLKKRGEAADDNLYHEANLILLDKKNLTRQYINRFLDPSLVEEDRLIEVSAMDLIIEFAKIDLGVGCVIEQFVTEELKDGSLIKLPAPTAIPKRKIGFAYRKEYLENKSVSAFLNEIQ